MLELYTKKSVRYKWNGGIQLRSQRNRSVNGYLTTSGNYHLSKLPSSNMDITSVTKKDGSILSSITHTQSDARREGPKLQLVFQSMATGSLKDLYEASQTN